jgi:hypothetical protein
VTAPVGLIRLLSSTPASLLWYQGQSRYAGTAFLKNNEVPTSVVSVINACLAAVSPVVPRQIHEVPWEFRTVTVIFEPRQFVFKSFF